MVIISSVRRYLVLTVCFSFALGTIYPQSPKICTEGPAKGHLIVAGGGLRDTSVYNHFIRLAGGPDAPIVVIPTASGDEAFEGDSVYFRMERSFNRRGFNNVTILHTRDPKEADSKAFVKPIREAGGVWFMGGRQWRLADSYLNTLTHKELNALLERGGVIGGSSAGATIQDSFLARNRQFDMFEILEVYPELLGIGLDENTAIHVHGDVFEVMGQSYVAIYDGTRWSAEREVIKN